MTTSMQKEWRDNQAFFAGALCAIVALNKLSELPEADAMKALAKLQNEIIEAGKARAALGNARN